MKQCRKELIFSVTKKDFKIQTFRSGGKGGQHQNKVESGVRIIHGESGAVGESRTHKSQYRNKREALKRLVDSKKFKLWVQRTVFELTGGKSIEQRVKETMTPENLKVEIVDDKGKWIDEMVV